MTTFDIYLISEGSVLPLGLPWALTSRASTEWQKKGPSVEAPCKEAYRV